MRKQSKKAKRNRFPANHEHHTKEPLDVEHHIIQRWIPRVQPLRIRSSEISHPCCACGHAVGNTGQPSLNLVPGLHIIRLPVAILVLHHWGGKTKVVFAPEGETIGMVCWSAIGDAGRCAGEGVAEGVGLVGMEC